MVSGRKCDIVVLIVIALFVLPTKAEVIVPEVSKLPNVVIIAIDTLRADHLGCYGYSRETSQEIDKLAVSGVLFDESYSSASWTLPSFMSIFTGLMPSVHGCTTAESKLSEAIPTLSEQFQKKGYYCGAVVSSMVVAGKYGFSRGFDKYDDTSVFLSATVNVLDSESGARGTTNNVVTGAILTHEAKSLLKVAERSEKPFFLFIHYFDPHDDYVPPPPYDSHFDREYMGETDGKGLNHIRYRPPTGRDIEHLKALYDGEVAYTDSHIGELIRAVDESSNPEDTLVILVSDHGESFGEHGALLHGNSAYREETRVPMIWRWQGVLPKGRRIKAPVSTMEIAKTLAKLMEMEDFELLQGQSLWPLLLDQQSVERSPVFTERAFPEERVSHVAMTTGNLRLHAKCAKASDEGKCKYELYDVERDPLEQDDILNAESPGLANMKSTLELMWLECRELRNHYGEKALNPLLKLTSEDKQRLESMGYIGGGGP